jgi:hypothetical protein
MNKLIVADKWRPRINRKFRHVIGVIFQICIKHTSAAPEATKILAAAR